MKFNYHTHTYLCRHATGLTEDYVKVALEHGFKVLGMSDHGPYNKTMLTPEELERLWLARHMSLDEFYQVYLPDVKAAQAKYQGKIKIYRGLETEYIPGNDDFYRSLRKELDYMNLGAHCYVYQGKLYNPYEAETNYKTVIGYAETIEKGLASGFFMTLVHPDLFMYGYVSKNGIVHEWDETCEKISRRIIEAAIKYHVFLELNCGCVRHGKLSNGEYYYPRTEFWKLVKQYPAARIIIGRDAHNPSELGDDITTEVEDFAKQLGLNIITDYDLGASHV